MSKVEVFEPALCCATGVCGEDVDQQLVIFSADLDFVSSRGGDITRYNLASEPSSFAENETVRAFLQVAGSSGLPLTLVDGITAMTGRYPDRNQLATWAGVESATGTNLLETGGPATEGDSCCGGNDSNASGCC
ncbi:arsenite efflux transporter metallochaperone ArsD [Mycolicibacterium hippocampi]|uniref:Arsenic resistance operon repressor n=1 Tax=Mycolicibacterium hippocampi TaxID=659824 RepID=A0A7I9ZW16_9MYCO|nr:arsenite efflux transporter metallochaperone ArsD [Mycolicibacterium hippocampi]GFH05221.1 arsenic resistance operon repressor [Mycolicibacterium hippocampi]